MRKNIAWVLCLIAAILLKQSVSAQIPPASVSLLEGVVEDMRNDAPIEGVRVSLAAQSGLAVTRETDVSGKFSVDKLSAGDYTIQFLKAGYVATSQVVSVVGVVGERIEKLKVTLVPTGGLEGEVVDDSRNPVAGATVVVLRVSYDGRHKVLLPPRTTANWVPGRISGTPEGVETVTDDKGRYRLFDIEPGRYYVAVWPNLGRDRFGNIVPEQYYPGVTAPDQAAEVVLKPGDDLRGINIRLAAAATHRFKFRVIGDPGCSIPGALATMHLIRQTPSGLRISIGSRSDASLAGPGPAPRANEKPTESTFKREGEIWVSPALYPGTYDVFYSSCQLMLHGALNYGHLRIELGRADLDVMTMQMMPSAPFRGRLTVAPAMASSMGPVRPLVKFLDLEERSPVLMHSQGGTIPAPPFIVSPTGDISFPYVAQGHYGLSISRLPPDAYVASVVRDGIDVRDSGLIHDGQPHEVQVLVDGPGGIVDGVVLSRLDRVVMVRAQVVVFPVQRKRKNLTLFKTSLTDREGRFSMRGIAPGEYGVLAFQEIDPNAYFNEEFLSRIEGRAVKIHVERGSTEHLTLSGIPAGEPK